ncbi:MAG: MoaD/ThiS family protein [Planctomycetota bacterium]|nr:MoaD/ThiS family protein [Planctomycetota bacterium]
MKVEVLLFASLRDLTGADRLTVELGENASVTDLLDSIADQHPFLKERVALTRVAIDDRFAAAEDLIPPESELALIPPVSGG